MKTKISNLYEKEWEQQQAPLIWVEMIYHGDIKELPKLVNFSFGGHYFESQKQRTIFYINTKIREQAERFGARKYRDSEFVAKLLKTSLQLEKTLSRISSEIRSVDLTRFTNTNLYKLLYRFFRAYARFVGLYRFTRPSFYDGTVAWLRERIPFPWEQNLKYLLANDFNQMSKPPTKRLREVARGLKQVGERRFAMHKVYLYTFQHSDMLFAEIARRAKITRVQAYNCTLTELKELLFSNSQPDTAELQRRLAYFRFVYYDDFFSVETGSPQSRQKKKKAIRVFKGMSASSGSYQGRVCVIKESLVGALSQQMQKMRHGEVLVTTSTSPDMMPAIRKAGAIVTDVGGMLSHAAIVSRELNVPCVIGTGSASSDLCTGDEVVVDADMATVTKVD